MIEGRGGGRLMMFQNSRLYLQYLLLTLLLFFTASDTSSSVSVAQTYEFHWSNQSSGWS